MKDLKQTEDGDICIDGGVQMTEPTEQHKYDILKASQGDFKQSPLVGVGLVNYVNSTNTQMLRRDISRQMQKDGIKVTEVDLKDGHFIINGKYENN